MTINELSPITRIIIWYVWFGSGIFQVWFFRRQKPGLGMSILMILVGPIFWTTFVELYFIHKYLNKRAAQIAIKLCGLVSLLLWCALLYWFILI